jgi:hypothetical protein
VYRRIPALLVDSVHTLTTEVLQNQLLRVE